MTKLTENTTIKRLRNKYRLVVMNDDTFEEIVTFKLTRVSVYIVMSSTFVLLVGLTTCLLVFTPLKFYIPGYGNKQTLTQLQLLKYRTDSLEQAITFKDKYLEGITTAISGGQTLVLDTTSLNIQKNEAYDDRFTPAPVKKDKKKRRR
jgi:hypothetical protein